MKIHTLILPVVLISLLLGSACNKKKESDDTIATPGAVALEFSQLAGTYDGACLSFGTGSSFTEYNNFSMSHLVTIGSGGTISAGMYVYDAAGCQYGSGTMVMQFNTAGQMHIEGLSTLVSGATNLSIVISDSDLRATNATWATNLTNSACHGTFTNGGIKDMSGRVACVYMDFPTDGDRVYNTVSLTGSTLRINAPVRNTYQLGLGNLNVVYPSTLDGTLTKRP